MHSANRGTRTGHTKLSFKRRTAREEEGRTHGPVSPSLLSFLFLVPSAQQLTYLTSFIAVKKWNGSRTEAAPTTQRPTETGAGPILRSSRKEGP